jgi:predicted aconitase with swiveling domain
MVESRTLVAGTARGAALVLDEPLSFWGGIEPATGELIDVRHPQRGANVAGRVLIMPSGRGSSSSSSVLAECVRAGTAPAAIVLAEPDPILALAAIVGRELYGRSIPVVAAEVTDVRDGVELTVRASDETAEIVSMDETTSNES